MKFSGHEEKKQNAIQRGWFGEGKRNLNGDNLFSAHSAPPPPKKRKTGILGLFSGLMTIFAVVFCVIASCWMVGEREFSIPGPLNTEKVVIIERGANTEEIVDQLTKEGVIERSTLFWIALFSNDLRSKFAKENTYDNRVKAGEYLFKKAISMNEVIDVITSGHSVEHMISIPEGLTSEQIVERLKDNDLLVGDIAQIPQEGSLLPDSYKINRGTSRQAFINRMQNEQKRTLQEIWSRRATDLPLKSPKELVILSSIVEKETGLADERSRVAGVFVNRLIKNMRLQSDPTIIYGLVGGKGTLGRPITRADIDKPTAFNTYVITGLPPSPIANPGRAAMEATANPSKTKDLFFVADGTGGHSFSENLEQHNRNVLRLRQMETSKDDNSETKKSPTSAASKIVPPISNQQDQSTPSLRIIQQ